jgi:hypothetical protein
MKNSFQSFFTAIAMAATVLVSIGCPVGLDYPLGKPDSEKLDKKLIGTWVSQSDDSEIKKVKVTKNDDYKYDIEVLERGEMYALETDFLTGWVVAFKGQNFICAQPTDGDDNKFYHYHYAFDGNKLVLHDMSLLVGGMDVVTSQETLQEEVAASMKKEDFLSSKVEYTKE